tara:strand:+ start:268 stop:480 length:213 start_codon:yes stop_codon:yes gene_type:complete
MIFNFDAKQYDSEKLSEKGKLYLQKVQNVVAKKSQLSFEYNDLEIIQKHYSDLLTKELPEEEKVEDKKEA